MSIFRSVLGVLLFMLVAVVLLGGACGPTVEPTPTSPPVVSGNQPPAISSLTAATEQLYPSENTEIRCMARDADGDQLDFKWECTGGSFIGDVSGSGVTWRAPDRYGTYDIKVTVQDGKGGSAQANLTITVGANQPPVISSLAASKSGVLYGDSTTVACIASDPDGDEVRYSWSASEGRITGVGNKVTWVAPEKGGNYNITVVVSDGRGGETMESVMVMVSAEVMTTTIRPVAEESGTVNSKGDRDNSRTRAGDDGENTGYRAFWSFDVWSLRGKRIDNASLIFPAPKQTNNPFPATTGLKGLRLWKVTYGDQLPNFNFTGSNLQHAPLLMSPPAVIDVTSEIAVIANAAVERFQIEALFMMVTNGNSVAEWIEWPLSEVVLEVTYSEK